ncbi:alkaline phosphatase family protein [Halorubrum rutilum]|uniref:Alkaline phosphatase family protein n=1 Tax=Halorubrum rutilum TaxID=1364933 RepID=A0ABD6AJY2_9EURY|nr:alkaline phosphatase family protein [Halorubrum rutilum]
MIVLGLDGATFSLIRPWAEAGHLPNFTRLFDDSTNDELESTVPEVTVPAWPTFATGRDPPDLDMYGFTHFNRDTRKNDLSHDEFVPGKMWDIVDDQGGRSVVFNIPGSYPWREIDGSIIAAAPEYKDEYAHPPERWEELQDLVGDYKLRNDEEPGSREYVELSLDLINKRFDAFEHLIERENPDLAVGLIRATDRVAHHYWGPDSLPSKDSEIFEVYEEVDHRLGEFLDAHDGENILVMSDHGFEKVRTKFAPNYVLEREGLVSLMDSGNTTKATIGSVRDSASDALTRIGFLTLARRVVPERLLTNIPTGDSLGLDNAISLERIDWDQTSAIADVGQKTTMIYVLSNDPSDIRQIVDRVEKTLQTAVDNSGLTVRFERLERGGPHTPDLTMVIETPEVHASSRFDVSKPLFDVDTSGHAREGILFARGPVFQKTGVKVEANIVDIAPTVLHALGYRLPESMSGSVLDLFQSGTDPAERDPETYNFVQRGETPNASSVTDNGEQEDEVKDRLRELGYLE